MAVSPSSPARVQQSNCYNNTCDITSNSGFNLTGYGIIALFITNASWSKFLATDYKFIATIRTPEVNYSLATDYKSVAKPKSLATDYRFIATVRTPEWTSSLAIGYKFLAREH